MTRAAASWVVAGGTTVGLLAGVFGSRLATKGMGETNARANIVLVSTLALGVAGAAIASYATTGKQLTA